MSFVLLKIFRNEIEMNLAQGKLESEGISTKLANSSSGPTKFGTPNEFGIYVPEDQMERAQAILATMIAFPNSNNPSVTLNWKIALLVVTVAMAVVIYYLKNHSV